MAAASPGQRIEQVIRTYIQACNDDAPLARTGIITRAE